MQRENHKEKRMVKICFPLMIFNIYASIQLKMYHTTLMSNTFFIKSLPQDFSINNLCVNILFKNAIFFYQWFCSIKILKKSLVLDCIMTNVTTVVTGKGEQLTRAGEWLWVPRSDVRNNDTRSKDPDLLGWSVIIPLYMSSPAHIKK